MTLNNIMKWIGAIVRIGGIIVWIVLIFKAVNIESLVGAVGFGMILIGWIINFKR